MHPEYRYRIEETGDGLFEVYSIHSEWTTLLAEFDSRQEARAFVLQERAEDVEKQEANHGKDRRVDR